MNIKDQAFYALETLNQDFRLEKEFKKEFPNNTLIELWDALKANLLSQKNQKKLIRVVTPVFEINNKLFLYGDDTRKYVNFIGDELDYQNVIELYDMTTEMETGNSFTLYVSSVENFKLAEAKDAVDVKIFLNSL